MDHRAFLERAASGYEARLAAVAPDQWDQPSTCDEWTIKDLADHVLGGNRYAVALLDGLDADQAFTFALEGGFDGDPVDRFHESAQRQLDAFLAPGALERTVQHPAGVIPATQYFAFRLGDLVLHGWDLARSTGGDESLDDELLPTVYEAYLPVLDAAPERRAFGDGASGTVPDDAPLSVRLLDLTGRRP